ncbi:MAG: PP2C family protein-serine/threonine phosphatase [Streptosporangiales bacterium]
MTLALRYAIRSDVGLLREGNEDAAYAGPRLLAVADGMGGHAAGEVASAAAIAAIARLDDDVPGGDLLDALAGAVGEANHTLHDMVSADPVLEGMGTTLTAMLWSSGRVALVHIGDSRAYLLRDGEFQQITHDHTLVQTLVDEGRISPDDVATHPQRSMLLRALDGRADVEPDLSLREARLGDRYLLCSDGLSGVVSEETLHRTLVKVGNPDEVVLQLVELAIRGGGPDNITCIVADVVDSATAPLPPSDTSVMVGAASNGSGGTRFRTDSPAGRAHLLTRTSPQVAVIAHDDPAPHRATEDSGHGHRRRRLPLVKMALAVLVVLIVGGAYAGWRYTQSQYYVAENGGKVVIYRGINQSVAGLSLFSVAQRSNIPVSGLPSMYASSVQATITSNNGLHGAQAILGNIQQAYQRCQNADKAVAAWEKLKPTKERVKVNGKLTTKLVKPPKPAIPADCPAPASAATGNGGSS